MTAKKHRLVILKDDSNKWTRSNEFEMVQLSRVLKLRAWPERYSLQKMRRMFRKIRRGKNDL
jgi:hypothetical protein